MDKATARKLYLQKCEDDMTFFFRNELKIRPKQKIKGGLVSLDPNPGQLQVIQTIDRMEREGRPVRILVLKARQWGCTTISQAIALHHCRFRDYYDSLVIGDREKTTRSIMAMNRRMMENLSPVITDNWTTVKKITDRMYEWSNGSILDIDTAGQGQASRGTTRDMIHGSECAFWPNGDKVIAALMPTVPDTPESTIILESTSNGPQGLFWELWESASDKWSEWERVFVPWTIHPEYKDTLDPVIEQIGQKALAGDPEALDEIGWLEAADHEVFLSGRMTLGQMHWKNRTLSTRFRGKTEDFQREFPETPEDAWAAAQYSYLTAEGRQLQIDAQLSSCKYELFIEPEVRLGPNPLVKVDYEDRPEPEPHEDGCIDVIEEPEPDRMYVMGVDPAEGTSNDNSAAVVRCDNEIVCVFYRNDLPTDVFAEYLFCIGRWYNDAQMIVERAGGGLAVINTLLRLNYPSMVSKESFDAFGESQGKQIGFSPQQENLRSLFAMFRHTINTGALLLRHERLVQEARWIIRRVVIKNDNVHQSWVCPSKGRQTPHGVRISDDVFRAAAMTELVSRDIRWIDSEELVDEKTTTRYVQVDKSDYVDDGLDNAFFDDPPESNFPRPLLSDAEFDEDFEFDEEDENNFWCK
jgi:hypothetical protein